MHTIKKIYATLFASLTFMVILLGSGCSTYTTNTDLSFTSTSLLDQEPIIHVGEITETPDKLTFLGSVEASVKRPSMFDDKPTIKQVNIVLAYQAIKMNADADAVIYVTYKTNVTESSLYATGQAVKINTANSYNVKKGSVQKALEKFGLNPEQPTQSAESAKIVNSSENEKFNQYTSDQKITNAKVVAMAKALAKAEARAEAEAEAARSAEDFAKIDANTDIDLLKHMISNAEYMMKIAKEHKDDDIYKVASILKRMLQQHLEKHQQQYRGY